ncbi:MAG TPA: hypothetical protein DIW23_05410 [Anaerolineae bacterium]|nr:hypothetical protein [Anaerolineae bacterium]HRJ74364.1 hypothetical protein [Anaerolineales bacterium]
MTQENKISELEKKLCYLAMEWRGNPNRREEIRTEYENLVKELFLLGWDDILDFDCELPDEFMPTEYIKRHPRAVLSKKSWKEFWRG